MPDSASLAPADAIVYATLTTDDGSSQWEKAEKVLERIPGARDGLAGAIEGSLAEEGLTWERDIAPALGPELVIVATADLKPVVLLQPEDDEKLTALLEKGDEEFVRGKADDWVALAQTEADLRAYETARGRGTLADNQALRAGLEALPEESLGKVWIDFEAITGRLGELQESLPQDFDLGVEWMSMALAAEDTGMLFAMGLRMPGAATAATSRSSSPRYRKTPSRQSPSAERRGRSTGSGAAPRSTTSRAKSSRRRASLSTASSMRSPARGSCTSGTGTAGCRT